MIGITGFYLKFWIINALLDKKLEYIFQTLEKIDEKGYYNDTAIAKLVSIAFVKHRDDIQAFSKLYLSITIITGVLPIIKSENSRKQ